ncbi:MAG: hypothetical protein E6L03_07595 [Thaumarchaeota archaeon]|nr:MAG: hypothetical protein E6L03_07595 [Nitrososphaerota archaeon]
MLPILVIIVFKSFVQAYHVQKVRHKSPLEHALLERGFEGSASGQFEGPTSVAITSSGNVHVLILVIIVFKYFTGGRATLEVLVEVINLLLLLGRMKPLYLFNLVYPILKL